MCAASLRQCAPSPLALPPLAQVRGANKDSWSEPWFFTSDDALTKEVRGALILALFIWIPSIVSTCVSGTCSSRHACFLAMGPLHGGGRLLYEWASHEGTLARHPLKHCPAPPFAPVATPPS